MAFGKPIKGICEKCAEEAEKMGVSPPHRWLHRKKPPACKYHLTIEKQSKKVKKKVVKKNEYEDVDIVGAAKEVIKRRFKRKKRKPTGELELFEEIFNERGPFSQVSEKQFFPTSHPAWIQQFSHVLSKGAYPGFRLYKKNIVLKTPGEHHKWEFMQHKIKDDPKWAPIFELKEELKEEYYAKRLSKEKH